MTHRNTGITIITHPNKVVNDVTTEINNKSMATLTNIFSAYGLPEQVITGNGPQFISNKFDKLMKKMELSIYSLCHIILSQTVKPSEQFKLSKTVRR